MDKYYYLAAQLPFLEFDKKTILRREDFLAQSRKWLSSHDYELLSKVDLNDFYSRPRELEVLKEYKDFERVLREEIASTRGVSQEPDHKAKEILKSQLLEGSPLDVERKLLRFRWEFIEEKGLDHYFNIEFLVFYFLKLQILERLFTFDKDKGTAVFDKLSEVNLDQDQDKDKEKS
jgi:hypothetical protein